MARLYSNENFPPPVMIVLRELGHDVLTSYESGNANKAIPDAEVLSFDVEQVRILLTLNPNILLVCITRIATMSGS
jgi:hypothetical protein